MNVCVITNKYETKKRLSLDEIKDHAKRLLLADGELRPVAFMSDADCTLLITDINEYFKDQHQKNIFAHMIRELAKRINAIEYVFITEAWIVTANPEEVDQTLNKGSLEFHPQRIEALIISHETETQQTIEYHQMIRDENNKIIRLEPHEDKKIDRMGGRMVGVLPMKGTPH